MNHWLLQSINGCGCRPPTVVVIGSIGAVVTVAINAVLPPMVAAFQWCRRLLHWTVGNGVHWTGSRYSCRATVGYINA